MRSERQDQSIARRELARHLEVSRTTLAALENNRSVRIATLERTARAIGVSLVVQPLPPDQRAHDITTTPTQSRHRKGMRQKPPPNC